MCQGELTQLITCADFVLICHSLKKWNGHSNKKILIKLSTNIFVLWENSHTLQNRHETMMHSLPCKSFFHVASISLSYYSCTHHLLPRLKPRSWSAPCNLSELPLAEQMGLMVVVIFWANKRAHNIREKVKRGDEMERIKRRSVTAAAKWEQGKREMDSVHHTYPFPPQWPQGRFWDGIN